VIELTRHDAVYVLQMRADGVTALVATGAGKIGDEIAAFLRSMLGLFARMLALRRIPDAAIHGHAFAGRGMRALAYGIGGRAVAEANVLPSAIAIAQERSGKDPKTLAALKRGLYAATLRVLEAEAPPS